MEKAPEQKINKKAIHVWWISEGFGSLFLWLVPFILPFLLQAWNLDFERTDMITKSIWILVGINTILRFTLIPYVRWRRWRFSIDDKEIRLRRGLLVVVNTLIPVKRVQHVDTRQGPLENLFDMASVTISTAATTHVIPLLSEDVAEELRDQISKFARLAHEEDV